MSATRYFLAVALASLSGLATLVVYDRILVRPHLRPAVRIGFVDVDRVYAIKEKEWSKLLLQTDPEEQKRASEMAKAFPTKLTEALEAIGADCDCLLLQKAAIARVSPDLIDLTSALREKLGLAQ